jgi:hypothetical protein
MLVHTPLSSRSPTAVAFRDARHGLLGTASYERCDVSYPLLCRGTGTIQITSNGGESWRVVAHTRRPVASLSVLANGEEVAALDDGETLASVDRGMTWRSAEPLDTNAQLRPPCAYAFFAEILQTPSNNAWALCGGQGGAGSQGKDLYRLVVSRWKRIAWSQIGSPTSHGGLDSGGYLVGFAMTDDGFGLIWKQKGDVLVTRDGGTHWTVAPSVVDLRDHDEQGVAGGALPHGVGYVLVDRLGEGGSVRLAQTTDAGRIWRIVHRWRSRT